MNKITANIPKDSLDSMITYGLSTLLARNGVLQALGEMETTEGTQNPANQRESDNYVYLLFEKGTEPERKDLYKAFEGALLHILTNQRLREVLEDADTDVEEVEQGKASPQNAAKLLEVVHEKVPEIAREGAERLVEATLEDPQQLQGIVVAGFNYDNLEIHPAEVRRVPFHPSQVYRAEPDEDYFPVSGTKDLDEESLLEKTRPLADRILIDMIIAEEIEAERLQDEVMQLKTALAEGRIAEEDIQEAISYIQQSYERIMYGSEARKLLKEEIPKSYSLEACVSEEGRKLLLETDFDDGCLRDVLAEYIGAMLPEAGAEETAEAYVKELYFDEDMTPHVHVSRFSFDNKEGEIAIDIPDYSSERPAAMYLDVVKRCVEAIAEECFRKDVVWNEDAQEKMRDALDHIIPDVFRTMLEPGSERGFQYRISYSTENDNIHIGEPQGTLPQGTTMDAGGNLRTEGGIYLPR